MNRGGACFKIASPVFFCMNFNVCDMLTGITVVHIKLPFGNKGPSTRNCQAVKLEPLDY